MIEAVLEAPRQILFAQQRAARGEAIDEMKADGIEYDERMVLLDQITWPQPLAELLEATYELYRESHPWLHEDALEPEVDRARDLGAGDELHRLRRAATSWPGPRGWCCATSPTPTATIRQTVPDSHRTPSWRTCSSGWGRRSGRPTPRCSTSGRRSTDPERVARRAAELAATSRRPHRPISKQDRAFRVMVRNAMWRRVDLVARDDLDGLMALERAAADRTDPPAEVVMTRSRWDEAIEAYYAEHDEVLLDADARGPNLLRVEVEGRTWRGPADAQRPRRPPRLGDRRDSSTSTPRTRPASWCWRPVDAPSGRLTRSGG